LELLSGNYGALLFIDLDRFKRINDAKGHAVGDMLLQEVATRLKDSLRQVDTVARFGGDEFVVVLPELGSEEAIATQLSVNIGEKICAKLSDSFILEGEKFRIGASIGITLFNTAQKTVNHLLKEADIAMYQAKASGSNMVRLFETTMQRDVEFHFTLDNELRHALKKNQFLVYLQPQVDKESRLVGAEALIRWSHPVMGMVPPGTFIPITEENGLIISIGEWVLQETCQYLASIQASGSRLQISVNVSPYQFRQSTFVSRVKAIVAATGIDATFLTLEVTEGLIIADIHQAIATMSALKVLGIHFSIDDFGTGYSSLPYLKRLLLNELKIDQSFVQDLPGETALIEAIIAIARHFKFAIVAEGVETIEQANFLKQRGCDFYQGYLYGKPMPMAEFDLMRIAALV
jgi:diguanylate cyclase (GGDEF)-like protein